MTRRRARFFAVIAALLAATLVSGCATIPTRGPVEAAPGFQSERDVGVQVAPEPPQPHSSPRTVVEGFLQAMSNYQPGYHIARQYLTEDVAESWRPESQVLIYADGYSVATTPESATLTAPLYGRIGPDGSFSRMDRTLKLDFGLQRNAEGEWRISRPPDGVVMTQYTFDNFYDSVNTYFFDSSFARLVPNPILLPRSNRTPTTLLQSLLRGPSEWLRPVVASAVPPQTRLNVQSASVDSEGVVDLSLTEDVLALDEERRTLMVTQMLVTLQQLPEVTGIRISVNGEPFPVSEQDARGVVPIDAAEGLAPKEPEKPEVFGLSDDGMVTVVTGPNGASLVPVPGPLADQPRATMLAVNTDGTQGAVVSQDETTLVVAPFSGDSSDVVVNNYTDLLRPDYVGASPSEVWFVGDRDGRQRIGMHDGKRTVAVDNHLTSNGRIINFAIAPDGVRFAAIRESATGRRELGIGLIDRSGSGPAVGHWRALSMADPGQPEELVGVDVGWISDTHLAVLVSDRSEPTGQRRIIRIDDSASRFTDVGQSEEWDVDALATDVEDGTVRAAVTGDGAWHFNDGTHWSKLSPELRAVAYPG